MVEDATVVPQKEEYVLPDEKATQPKEDTPSPQAHRPLPSAPKADYPHTERQQHQPLRLTMGLYAQGNANDMNSANGVVMNTNMMYHHAGARAYLLMSESNTSIS